MLGVTNKQELASVGEARKTVTIVSKGLDDLY